MVIPSAIELIGNRRKEGRGALLALPCPRRRPAHPYLEYRAICHAGPAISSTVHHDWWQQAPRSSRKIPPSFSTRLPDGVFVTHSPFSPHLPRQP